MPQPKSRTSVELIRQMIRKAGLRATPGRIAVLRHLTSGTPPHTHAELVGKLGDGAPDTSTVFRALNDLADAGLLRRVELGDHAWRFELARETSGDNEAHPHFVCVDCGKITCLSGVDIRQMAGSSRTLRAAGQVSEVVLKGHCPECL